MMCQVRKNVQTFGAIFGVPEKSITEKQNGCKIRKEGEELTSVLKKE